MPLQTVSKSLGGYALAYYLRIEVAVRLWGPLVNTQNAMRAKQNAKRLHGVTLVPVDV